MFKGGYRRVLTLGLIAAAVVGLPALAAAAGHPGVGKAKAVAHTKIRIGSRAHASAASDRRLARAGATRYPVGDAKGRTVAVSVTTACAASGTKRARQAQCTALDLVDRHRRTVVLWISGCRDFLFHRIARLEFYNHRPRCPARK